MSVGGRPPNLEGFDSSLFLDLRRYLVVNRRGIQADIGRNQIELRGAIIHRHNPMEQMVVHSGGLPRAITQKPL